MVGSPVGANALALGNASRFNSESPLSIVSASRCIIMRPSNVRRSPALEPPGADLSRLRFVRPSELCDRPCHVGAARRGSRGQFRLIASNMVEIDAAVTLATAQEILAARGGSPAPTASLGWACFGGANRRILIPRDASKSRRCFPEMALAPQSSNRRKNVQAVSID